MWLTIIRINSVIRCKNFVYFYHLFPTAVYLFAFFLSSSFYSEMQPPLLYRTAAECSSFSLWSFSLSEKHTHKRTCTHLFTGLWHLSVWKTFFLWFYLLVFISAKSSFNLMSFFLLLVFACCCYCCWCRWWWWWFLILLEGLVRHCIGLVPLFRLLVCLL